MKILVPLDPARPAPLVVDVAVALARPAGEVELVAVVPADLPEPIVDAFLAAERDRHPSAPVATRRLDGPDIVGALLEHIVRVRPELVVLDSHGRGPLGELVLGSVSADLVRSSPAPTLLVGPACRPDVTLERLVVAVDGSADARSALDVAVRLAGRLGAPVELVEVAEDPPFGSDVAESAELHRLAASVDPPVRFWDVLHGTDVSRALVEHVRPDRGAVLVVGTHGRSPGRPNVLGGVAAKTVRHATVPVLVVSPEAAATDQERMALAQPV